MDNKNIDIKKQNTILNRKIQNIKLWIQREIKGNKNGDSHKQELIEKIYEYFGEYLTTLPENTLRHIYSAEVVFETMIKNEDLDGMQIIIEYQKVFDAMVEMYISIPFRKFVQTKYNIPKNDESHLESALFLISSKNYSLSAGRLYELVLLLKDNQNLSEGYRKEFMMFLGGVLDLREILMSEKFIGLLKQLVDIEILGEKRHSGYLDISNTREARKIYIGNFDTEGLLLLLASSQKIIP